MPLINRRCSDEVYCVSLNLPPILLPTRVSMSGVSMLICGRRSRREPSPAGSRMHSTAWATANCTSSNEADQYRGAHGSNYADKSMRNQQNYPL